MKRSTSRTITELVEWRVSSALTAAYNRGQDDRTLVLSIVFGDGCQVVALETVAKEKVNQGGLDSIFSDHAHQVVGHAPDLYEALALAKRAVKNWRKGTPVSACGCKEIDSPPEVRISSPPRRVVGNRSVPMPTVAPTLSCRWWSQGNGKDRFVCMKNAQKADCFCKAHRLEYDRIVAVNRRVAESAARARKIAEGLSPKAIMPKKKRR